jgi:hypothetical protein
MLDTVSTIFLRTSGALCFLSLLSFSARAYLMSYNILEVQHNEMSTAMRDLEFFKFEKPSENSFKWAQSCSEGQASDQERDPIKYPSLCQLAKVHAHVV